MKKTKRLVLFGDSAFAEVAYEYFTHDSEYEVCAFTVSREFLTRPALFGVPVVPFEEVARRFPPEGHEMYVALVYRGLNSVRRRFYEEAKAQGYRMASYVSPRAFVWRNVRLGEHVFVFENNVLQPFAEIGDNVVLWSGNHIGHHSRVGAHCFLSSHVVVSGFASIGESSFVGVNATLSNNITVGPRSVIGAGALVLKDCPESTVIRGNASRPDPDRRGEEVRL